MIEDVRGRIELFLNALFEAPIAVHTAEAPAPVSWLGRVAGRALFIQTHQDARALRVIPQYDVVVEIDAAAIVRMHRAPLCDLCIEQPCREERGVGVVDVETVIAEIVHDQAVVREHR